MEGREKEDKPAFTFKTSEFDFHFLSDECGFRLAPYFASRGMKWIQFYDMPSSENDKLIYYLKKPYHIVSLGLTKKKQKEPGINQE